MTLPTWDQWLFAIKTFAAAMLALYLALWFDLPRPYWAMASVYVASQPLSGATRSKALYRLLGTAIGASFSVFIVPLLINSPELLTGAVALWTGLCLYLSLLDRTPRSYLFMLSGYTAALIVFPSVSDPGAIFDTSLARFEEITLGILCASLVSSIVLPRRVGPVVNARIQAWLRDAGLATIDVLAGLGSGGAEAARRANQDSLRLAADAVAVDGLIVHLGFDLDTGRATVRWVGLLRQRMLVLLPILSSLSDRLTALSEAGALDDGTKALLKQVEAWMRQEDDAPSEEAERLRGAIAAATPVLDETSPWHEIVLANLMSRLRDLVDLRQDCRVLQRHIAKGWGRLRQPLAFAVEASSHRHVDRGMALLSAAGVMTAILITSAAWILTGWSDGGNAAVMAAVACSFFSTQDNPAPGIMVFAKWTVVSVVVVTAYSFAIFPAINGFAMLVAALAPFFLIVGLLIAAPSAGMTGMILGANGATFLAVQSGFSADFAGFMNSSLAAVIGMWSSAILLLLYRSVGAEFSARRLMRAGRLTIARAAERRGRGDRAHVAALLLDRLGLVVPRLATLKPDGALSKIDMLAGVRVGLNVVELRAARHQLPAATVAAIDAMLARLAAHYRSSATVAGQPLLDAVDAALRAVLAIPGAIHEREALLGLVGIRRGLFPGAPAYEPGQKPAAIDMKVAA